MAELQRLRPPNSQLGNTDGHKGPEHLQGFPQTSVDGFGVDADGEVVGEIGRRALVDWRAARSGWQLRGRSADDARTKLLSRRRDERREQHR